MGPPIYSRAISSSHANRSSSADVNSQFSTSLQSSSNAQNLPIPTSPSHPNSPSTLNVIFDPDAHIIDDAIDSHVPPLLEQHSYQCVMQPMAWQQRTQGTVPNAHMVFTSHLPLSIPFLYTFPHILLEDTSVPARRYARDPLLTYEEISRYLQAISSNASPRDIGQAVPDRYKTPFYPMTISTFLRLCSNFILDNGRLCDRESGFPIAQHDPYATYKRHVERWRANPFRANMFNESPKSFNSSLQLELGLYFTDGLVFAEHFLGTQQLPFHHEFGSLIDKPFLPFS
ncbi:hypothetical protein VNI00_017926 [Paramarasmius palmivorus]|uniref:Uncharacterized protein n=1 Tax=Paramarasmius palmivorus TaxID=297713 RepID=A0AAW0B3L6_9AGAR